MAGFDVNSVEAGFLGELCRPDIQESERVEIFVGHDLVVGRNVEGLVELLKQSRGENDIIFTNE